MSTSPYGAPTGSSTAFNIQNIYPNAFFDYLSRMLPRRLKQLFVWLEYLYVNCGQVFSVIKKFSEYPITSLTFETEDKQTQKKVENIMHKHIKAKAVLIQVGIDYFVYGNSFTSLFRPFTRYLTCKKCKHKHNALNHPYEWMPQKFEFKIKCSNCKHLGIAEVSHEVLKDTKRLKVIRWDPKDIDINSNPITGESEYYYTIPKDIRQRIKAKKPDKFLLNTMPWDMLLSIKNKKIFKFRDGQIYHLRNPAPAGINQEWGYPGLLGALKPYFYTAVLRKGNEAIALERMVPWRVMYPNPSSSSNDPGMYVALSRWKNELQSAVQKWRKDPNMVKLSPIPVGVSEIGGNGRPLLTHQELALTEENIITSMGVPKEFVVGGLTHAGGSVTLRMLENLLFTYTEQLIDFSQWLTDAVCRFANLKKVEVNMTDFKLIDDIQQKQLIGELYKAQEVSADTFMKTVDINSADEREKIIAEAVSKATMQAEIQKKLKDIEDNLATKVDAQMQGSPLQYDPNAVMQVAYQEAQTLIQLPIEDRNARLEQIKSQDPVLHTLAKTALNELYQTQKQSGMLQQAPGNVTPMSPSFSGGSSQSTPMAGR